ncbi:hypothetical protein [uncultured Methanobrevibacter sp.]|uniref:hypothetical protein n=1 Tax=uncultured Methanobrevibacter sp. TaxID=253161 RepID=UPI0025F6FC9C|nr:hypothetical protein [uncultured Methanobrevibacter sp.]
MKNKTFVALIAFFLVAAGAAAVYAESAHVGSFNFDVPNDFKVKETNDTTVVLQNDKKEIIITSKIVGKDAVNSYLSGQGFKFNETINGTKDVKGTGLNGHYSYTADTFSKDKGYAIAYLLTDKNVSVIAIDNDFNSDDNFDSSDLSNAVGGIVDKIMLSK